MFLSGRPVCDDDRGITLIAPVDVNLIRPHIKYHFCEKQTIYIIIKLPFPVRKFVFIIKCKAFLNTSANLIQQCSDKSVFTLQRFDLALMIHCSTNRLALCPEP